MKEVKHAAVYCRVSSRKQAEEGISLEAQQSECERYVKEQGWKLIGTFVDAGKSGGLSYKKRPALREVISLVEEDKIDIIVVVKLDRLFRSMRGFYDALKILEEHGCGWYCTREPQYDTSTAAGEMMLNTMLSAAQFERRNGSERVRMVQEDVVRRGGVISGSAPYGFDIKVVDGKKTLVPDMDKIAIVKEAFERYIETQSMQATRVYIADKYDQHWTHQAFTRIIQNDIYIGKYRGNPHYCDPVLPRELVEQVRAINTNWSGAHWKKKNVFLFARLLRCPKCGRVMQGTTDRKKNGEKVYYYRCQHVYSRAVCDYRHSIPERKIEVQVVQQFGEYIEKEKIALTQSPKKQDVPNYEKRKKSIEQKMSRLTDIYLDGTIEKSVYEKRYNPLKEELDDIIQKMGQPVKKKLDRRVWDDFDAFYSSLSREDKQKFWSQTLDRIEVSENKEVTKIVI